MIEAGSIHDRMRDELRELRTLVQTEIKPRGVRFLDGTFPWENIRALAKLGVLGMAAPRDYGGSERSVFETALALEELAKGCYVTAMATLGEVGAQTRIVSTYAPESIKRRHLPRVCVGEEIFAICFTEPHAGTDVAAYRTNASPKGAAIILNGVKAFVSRAEEASLFVVFTRVEGRPGLEGIGCALVEAGAPGLSIIRKSHSLGGENLCDIKFENCEIPADQLIVKENGFKRLMSAFNTQRCLNPSISLGLAEGAFEESIAYAKARQAFGRSIGDFQGMRWKLADMYSKIEQARGVLYRACASANPFPDPFLAATAKVACNEMSIDVTSEAVQIHGGSGVMDDNVVSRLFRGARYGTLGGGTSETLRDLVGKQILGRFDPSVGIASLN